MESKHGDAKTAANLRGALAPGNANYNTRHHMEDVLEMEREGIESMYAGEVTVEVVSSGHKVTDSLPDLHCMHNRFLEALKNKIDGAKELEHHVMERDMEEKHLLVGNVE